MPKYKLVLTVQDSFGMTKEIDGGEIDVGLVESLTPADIKHIEEELPLEDYIKKTELPEELEELGLTSTQRPSSGQLPNDPDPEQPDNPEQPDGPEKPNDPVLPDDSDSITGAIVENKTPMYQINENDEIVEVTFIEPIVYDEAADVNDKRTGFYIVVENGETVEAGYQHHTERKDPYYIIALPEELEVTPDGNVLLQTWSAIEDRWVAASYVLTSDYSEIVATYEADGISPPVAPEGYKLWADLSDSDPGTSYRFVIKE